MLKEFTKAKTDIILRLHQELVTKKLEEKRKEDAKRLALEKERLAAKLKEEKRRAHEAAQRQLQAQRHREEAERRARIERQNREEAERQQRAAEQAASLERQRRQWTQRLADCHLCRERYQGRHWDSSLLSDSNRYH